MLVSNILFTFSLAQLRLSVLEEADPLGFREGDMHCIHCQFFGVIHSGSYFRHSGLEASKINFLPAANCQTPQEASWYGSAMSREPTHPPEHPPEKSHLSASAP